VVAASVVSAAEIQAAVARPATGSKMIEAAWKIF
jgi:hypothetical protein